MASIHDTDRHRGPPGPPGQLVCSRGVAEKEGHGFRIFGAYCRNNFKVFGGDILLNSIAFFGPLSVPMTTTPVTPTTPVATTTPMTTKTPMATKTPVTSSLATYTVEVFVETSIFDHRCHRAFCGGQFDTEVFGSFRGTVEVKKGELMVVNFGHPILIPEGQWRTITFMLKGHVPTARLKMSSLRQEVTTRTVDGQRRKFEFLRGSSQMPQIHFSVP